MSVTTYTLAYANPTVRRFSVCGLAACKARPTLTTRTTPLSGFDDALDTLDIHEGLPLI